MKLETTRKEESRSLLISDVHYLKLPGRRRAGPSHLRCSLLETTRKEESRSLSSQTVHYLKLPGRKRGEQVPLISDVHYLKLAGR